MDLSASCSGCGASIQPEARYCAACGRNLNTRLLQSERRSLTFVFCDLVDSVGLSKRLDPEDLVELLGSYQAVCRDAVAACEGRGDSRLGGR
jgi:class 3 adenylate cyclase